MHNGYLEESLLSVISNTGGKDLLNEAAEFSIDSMLPLGILKDIPVIGTVAGLYNIALGVQGYVFAKKIRSFCFELSKLSQSQRNAFTKKLDENKKLRSRTAEVLIMFLDQIDDLEKAPLLSRAFSGYLR